MPRKQLITGLKELEKALQQLPNAVASRTLITAMRKAARPILQTAIHNAMRFRNPGTYSAGQLADSLKIGTVLNKRQRRIFRKRPGNAVIYVGPSWPMGAHAHFKEFGTSKQQAEPFLRPAWDMHQAEFLTTFKREAWKALEKARKKLAQQRPRVT
ncbi:MAG: hypothetical protein NPIRA03_06760 [Nitrospirales bacterium]|nr:MAG: hypothetical protein NPIRA03_06760 [Nitrospirales bacterium]